MNRKTKCPKCHRVLRLVRILDVGFRWIHMSPRSAERCESEAAIRKGKQLKLFDGEAA